MVIRCGPLEWRLVVGAVACTFDVRCNLHIACIDRNLAQQNMTSGSIVAAPRISLSMGLLFEVEGGVESYVRSKGCACSASGQPATL